MTKKLLIILGVLIIVFLILARAGASTITFGAYWQSYEIDGAKAPIEWVILEETDDSYLLISKYSLDASIFNNTQFTTWKTSQVRSFLNSYFYENAFSKEEQEQILLTKISTPKNPTYPSTAQGSITYDKVFLLSIQEAQKYLSTAERSTPASDFARIGHARVFGQGWKGAFVTTSGNTYWWLRTMGIDNYHASNILPNGAISYGGDILFAPHYALRPCIWLSKEVKYD